MLSLLDYRCVIALVNHRHFRFAAEEMGMTQPAMTARLRRIEEQLDAKLFNRGRSGVTPTDAGLAFVEGARRILDLADETADAARGARDGIGQTIRIGMSQVAAYQVVAPAMTRFRRAFPSVSVRLIEGRTAGLEIALEKREIDAAFLHPPLHGTGLSDLHLRTVDFIKIELGTGINRSLVGYPRNEAPVLMAEINRKEGVSETVQTAFAEADTVLGVAILSEAGYGGFVAPEDFPHPAVQSAVAAGRFQPYVPFETSIAWRTLDRRPLVRGLVDAAREAFPASGV